MPTGPVVHFAVFAAGAALGVTAAALAQRRNDRSTLPATPRVSTSAIARNTEISRLPAVEVSPTGNAGLARFQGVGSEVLKHGDPGESLHPFICRGRFLDGLKLLSFQIFSEHDAGLQNFATLRITCLSRVQSAQQ
jgi:hypothetical protein